MLKSNFNRSHQVIAPALLRQEDKDQGSLRQDEHPPPNMEGAWEILVTESL